MLKKFLHGILAGTAFVLPGLSVGTVILILGFYRRFLADVAALHLRPYLPLVAGGALGALVSVHLIGYLLGQYRFAISAFLLGLLLASIPTVLSPRPALHLRTLLLAVCGFFAAWFVIGEPTQRFTILPPGGSLHFFLGGALASSTMLLPGVSGGAVLIIMNLYDDLVFAVTQWQWPRLFFFAAGFCAGILSLARLLTALYSRYRGEISMLLAGLILGSTRVLLPGRFSFFYLFAAAAGALLVLFLTHRKTPERGE